MNVVAEEDDFSFDEIGSALKIKALQNEKEIYSSHLKNIIEQ